MQASTIIKNAIESIALQASAIDALKSYINSSFAESVLAMHQCSGRIVVTGIGKSAIIAQKIVATLNSTGTPALFMHAADAIHGDLGMVQEQDVVILISKSGNSPEIKVLIPLIKGFGNKLIAITGNMEGYLALHADLVLNTTVDKEACPNNLAPTTSTTAQMVMGDALAVCLLHLNGFNDKDFARYHPGGALGKQLYLRVQDVSQQNEVPVVHLHSNLKEIIHQISSKRLGATAVLADNGTLAGIITDGDLRRMLEQHEQPTQVKAFEIMSAHPKCIEASALATEALSLMKQHDISQLVIMQEGHYKGILHVHDLVREGIL